MKLELWHIKLVAILAALVLSWMVHDDLAKKAIKKAVEAERVVWVNKVDSIRKEQAQIKQDLERKSLEAEKSLIRSREQLKEKKDAEIKNLNARYNALVSSLQQRPERPADSSKQSSNNTSSSNSESSKGATGKELYADDGRFLARFAKDTEQLKQELIMCYKQYDEVRDKVNNFPK